MIRLGRDMTGKNVTLDPFDAAHTVITGRTRTGKSVQVYGMLAGLRGLPVQACGIDPTGILFNPLGDALGGADLRVLTLRDPERVRQVMSDLIAEMDRRIVALLDQGLDKYDQAHFTDAHPLLVVVLEEYPGILAALQALDQASGAKAGERIETQVRAAIQRLALEGAKVGVRLWIIAQRADASLLTGVLRSQLTQRISFAQDDDGLRMLHEGITPEQIEASARFIPGQAYVEMHGVMPLTKYRADFIDYGGLCAAFEHVPHGSSRDGREARPGATTR